MLNVAYINLSGLPEARSFKTNKEKDEGGSKELQSFLHGDAGVQGASAHRSIKDTPSFSLGLLTISREHVSWLSVPAIGGDQLCGRCPREMVPIGSSICI